MDLPNILNNRGPVTAAAVVGDQSLQQYADLSGRPTSDTGSDRGMSPHGSDPPSRYPSRTGPYLPAMSMPTAAPHLQQQFTAMVSNPYPTPTESIDNGFARAQNDEQLIRSSALGAEGASQTKSFACSTCRKGFARRSDLARHERIHSGVRPHVCEHLGCGKQFIQRSALTVHSRVHTGEKPHMCEHCTKPFSDSSSLARHRRIHSGKRPYKCPYADCQKTFTRRTTLTRHQSHHSGTVEESIATKEATLASRPPTQPGRTRPDGITYSDTGSANSSPSSEQNTMARSPANGELLQTPSLARQHSDIPFAPAANLPPHLRGDFGQNTSRSGSPQSPSLMGFGLPTNRPSFTSHPNMYGQPPSTMEPPAQFDQRSNGSASGSPSLGVIGWQSPSHGGLGSPVTGTGYSYPEPYDMPTHQLYYGGSARRPQSTEPDQYEMKPRLGSNTMWAEQLS